MSVVGSTLTVNLRGSAIQVPSTFRTARHCTAFVVILNGWMESASRYRLFEKAYSRFVWHEAMNLGVTCHVFTR